MHSVAANLSINPNLIWGRILMADTLAFHIFFALLGVGIPLLISLAELIGIVRQDVDFKQFARRWGFAMSVLFVVGAISGTVVAFELILLWPNFMAFAAPAIGLPMYMEVVAFFVEAVFLGIYLYTWDRFSPWRHWLCSLPIILASAASAFLITTVNAFMNNPDGITLAPDAAARIGGTGVVGGVAAGSPAALTGAITSVNPWAAMFNAAVPTETGHSILAYYATTAFISAAMAAIVLLRRPAVRTSAVPFTPESVVALANRPEIRRYAQKALSFSLGLALVFSLLVGLTGDQSARFVAGNEPIKFAAMENVQNTEANVPFSVFGFEIPGALSMLAGGSRDVVIQGLASFDASLWPPAMVHIFFDLMAVGGVLLIIVPLIYFVLLWLEYRRNAKQRRFEGQGIAAEQRTGQVTGQAAAARNMPPPRSSSANRWPIVGRMSTGWPILWLIIFTSLAAIFCVEAGWIVTEVGRQPYVINGIMTTAQAFTKSAGVVHAAIVFPIFYLILAAVAFWILIRHYVYTAPL